MPPVREGEEGAGSGRRGAVRWERGRVRGRERGAVLCAVAGGEGESLGERGRGSRARAQSLGGEGVALGRRRSGEWSEERRESGVSRVSDFVYILVMVVGWCGLAGWA